MPEPPAVSVAVNAMIALAAGSISLVLAGLALKTESEARRHERARREGRA